MLLIHIFNILFSLFYLVPGFHYCVSVDCPDSASSNLTYAFRAVLWCPWSYILEVFPPAPLPFSSGRRQSHPHVSDGHLRQKSKQKWEVTQSQWLSGKITLLLATSRHSVQKTGLSLPAVSCPLVTHSSFRSKTQRGPTGSSASCQSWLIPGEMW